MPFFFISNRFKHPLKTGISVGKVSSNSIVQFLNFALKITKIKFNPTGICDEGAGLVVVVTMTSTNVIISY